MHQQRRKPNGYSSESSRARAKAHTCFYLPDIQIQFVVKVVTNGWEDKGENKEMTGKSTLGVGQLVSRLF